MSNYYRDMIQPIIDWANKYPEIVEEEGLPKIKIGSPYITISDTKWIDVSPAQLEAILAILEAPEKKEPRIAYFILESVRDDNGDFIPLIAKEGDRGYYRTNWAWGKDLALAWKCADRKNERLGLSREDVSTIVTSTMKRPDRDDDGGEAKMWRAMVGGASE